jgi:hypothetical protein
MTNGPVVARRLRLAEVARDRVAHLGIGVSASAVRGLLVRSSRVVWAGEAEVTPDRPLEEALNDLLTDMPSLRWSRVRAVAAIGPWAAQLRRLTQLPPTANQRLLSAIVREDAGRYFLRNGVPLVTTTVDPRGQDVWGGAIERPIVEALLRVCSRHRIRMSAVVPTVSVLSEVTDAERVAWPDGDVVGLLEVRQRRLVGYRRVSRTSSEAAGVPEIPAAPALARIPGVASRFMDAWAAANTGRGHRVAYRPDRTLTQGQETTGQHRSVLVAAAVFVATAIISGSAYAIRAHVAERHARQTIAALRSQTLIAAREERALASEMGELRSLTAFDRSARLMTLMLAAITDAVEAPTMLVSFKSDSTGGTVVAVTPDAATLVEELSAVPEIATPTIVGPVTPVQSPTVRPLSTPAVTPARPQDTQPGEPERAEPMQRVTIHFAWESGARATAGLDIGPAGKRESAAR